MMEQWNGGMMGLKKTDFKAYGFALIFLALNSNYISPSIN